MKTCENIQDKLVDYVDQKLPQDEMDTIASHIKNCEACSKELKEIQQLFSDLSQEEMERPSAALRMNFEQFLGDEKAKETTKVISLEEKTSWKVYLRVAASILIVVSAFLIGKYSTNLHPNTAQTAQILEQLKSESASQRIAALSLSEKTDINETKIIQAFINRLLYDEKPSVRLTAVEALAKFSSLEMVKDALIKSLESDNDPAIQIELIQVLVSIQEKRALTPMKNLLNNDDVPDYVKQEVQINIHSLS